MTNFLEPTINKDSEILDKDSCSLVLERDKRLGLADYVNIAKTALVAF